MKEVDSIALLIDSFAKADGADFLDKTFYFDIAVALPDDLTMKMDIASMANSLETRAPYLDHRLMEFAAQIPPHIKLKRMRTKYLLRKALSGLVPSEILRRGKKGFGVPIGSWFRHELKDLAYDILLDPRSVQRGYFDMGFVKKMLDEHISGKIDHGYRIWALLNLELWHRMFIDSDDVSQPSLSL